MHAAPSVTYPVGRSAFAGMLLAMLAVAGLVAVAAFTWQPLDFGWRHAAAWAVLVAAVGLAAMAWLRSARGVLAYAELVECPPVRKRKRMQARKSVRIAPRRTGDSV